MGGNESQEIDFCKDLIHEMDATHGIFRHQERMEYKKSRTCVFE